MASTMAVPAGSVSGDDAENDFEERGATFSGSPGYAGSPSYGVPGDALEESIRSAGEAGEQECAVCCSKLCAPRVLSCLHVFCEACLDKLLIDEAGDSKLASVLNCPLCRQETNVGAKGAASLAVDYVLTNILDMSAIENMAVLCTSCKAKENAVARCSDCANFLCPNCNTAHQFMRCFESHKVVAFEDLKRSNERIPIHKPIFCTCHPAENMKFFCYTCQEPICNECLLVEHKAPDHQYERLSDAEPRQKEELAGLMAESKARIADCDQASSQLENALSELQVQHDQAKDLIVETFQSYKAVLEKCRDSALEDLEKLHSERELEIMDTFHSVEKTVEKIEDACRFTSRLLEHGDAVEILALRRVVGTQLINLIKNTPKPNVTFSIEFQTDYNHFEKTVKEAFGKFRTENTSASKAPQELLPAVQPIPPVQPTVQIPVHTSIGCAGSLSTSSPISLPASMQSSFEGEPSFVIPPTSSPQNVPPPPPPVSLPPAAQIHGLTSIQEYNLQQLASLAEKVDMVGDSAVGVEPTSNPSPTPSFTLADLFAGDLSSTSHAMNNLQALAKLGNTLGNQDLGNATLNGGGSLVLGRGPSPGIVDTPNLGPLASNSILNGGFQSLSSSTSPILSQAPVVGNTVGSVNGSGTGNYAHARSSNPKLTPMQIRSKFGQLGPSKGQFNSPHGFCLGTDEDIIVADTNNHRIQVFEKTGTFRFQFGIPGKEEGQLWYPRKVAVMRNSGKFVVCDRGNERSRMQIFTKNGHFIKKIAIRYIDIVAGLAVTSQGHIVAVDSVSPTVFIISDTGDLMHWFDCSDYMREPSDIAISGKEYFVCDFKGHCVVVFDEAGHFLRRIGCENITNFPNGIDISDAGDVLIGDSHGNRFHVAVFSRDGSLISEFECPYVKVSRCCGLKITSEGYIVTLAKNNHHVLVLNTLYIL
ncbi:brain tumor protein isoform X2 [Cephus cinctus]|uniref:Brain tumor protein isoform X2 n=1 Tax=Cephus cinctus TaxID=211228 RepID=A0AAJ7BXN3_CEPCN|nr:brain tumor protein isoform X2 [Cephus cinctus]